MLSKVFKSTLLGAAILGSILGSPNSSSAQIRRQTLNLDDGSGVLGALTFSSGKFQMPGLNLSGNFTFTTGTTRDFGITAPAAGNHGNDLRLYSADATASGGLPNRNGGDVYIVAGLGTGTGTNGVVHLRTGGLTNIGVTADAITLNADNSVSIPSLSLTGNVNLGDGADRTLTITSTAGSPSYSLIVKGQDVTAGVANGGDVIIKGGATTGGTTGNVQLNTTLTGYTEFKGRMVLDKFTAAAAATINMATWNQSIFRITASGWAANITLSSVPAAVEGQMLYIVNEDTDADLLDPGTGFNVPRNSRALYIYINGAWLLTL